jgi:hypothetical protein
MAITDLFSTSFLFSIAIIVILIGGIFAYVSYRMTEQDHKFNSMIGLISSMAEETQFFRSKISMLQQQISSQNLPVVDKIQYASQMMGGNKEELIDVSDDEDEDEDDEDEDEDDEDEDEDDDHDEDDEDNDHDEECEECEDEDDDDHQDDNITILNLSLINEKTDNNLDIENMSITDFEPYDCQQDIKTVHLEQEIHLNDDINFLKNESLIDLDDNDDVNESKTDYKKLQINKLREIVVSKGIISDASKLKKHEILKLLGDE